MTILGFEFAAPALGLGIVLGLTYALLAAGLVLVYRNSKLVNFAHGDIGVGAAVLMWVAYEAGIPYWVCLPIALAIGGALAAILDRSVVERLRHAPRAIAALATLGAGQLVSYVAITLLGVIKEGAFPQPSGIEPVHLGTLILQPAHVLAVVLGPLAIASLVLLMTKTPTGLALRAAGADADLARVSGFSSGRLSAFAWGLSGVLSTLTAALLLGLESDSPPPTGLDLLLAALAAAVIARMSSLVVAGVAGFGLGITQHLLLWNDLGPGSFRLAMFVTTFIALLFAWRHEVDLDKRTRWLSLHVGRRVGVGHVRVPIVPLATLACGSVLLLLLRPTDATKLTTVLAMILVALSAAVVTGLAGQLILGQAAYAGIGAFASVALTLRTGNFFLGFAAAAACGAVAAFVSSLPALRRRDLSLAVVSLAFTFACVSWAFPQTWMFGGGIEAGRPIIGSFPLTTARSYGLFALVVLCVGLMAADVLWRSALARHLAAQRDNPPAAATFGILETSVRAQALLISGAFAGVAGALLAHAAVSVEATDFSIQEGLRALGGAALGGITSVPGVVWGTLFMIGLPAFVGGILGFIAAGWVAWLLVIVTIPGGIDGIRQRWWRGSRGPSGVTRHPPERTRPLTLVAKSVEHAPTEDLLEMLAVSLEIGDLAVLQDVTLRVKSGEIIGVVGRNGAGKSTLLDVISGQRVPQRGSVCFDGRSIVELNPARRARLGIVRSFEGAILFPTLTVFETTLMALENPTSGEPIPRRSRQTEAMAMIRWTGLQDLASTKVGDLSTGLRRMAQLACLAARRPRLLLLDEPASGVAQAELDGLAGILQMLRRDLNTTVLVVEHDIRLVTELADRVVVLDAGRVAAEGPPADVGGPGQAQG